MCIRDRVVAALLDCGYAPFSQLGAFLLSAYRCQVVQPVLWVERRAEHVEEGASAARLPDGLSAGASCGADSLGPDDAEPGANRPEPGHRSVPRISLRCTDTSRDQE